MTGYICIGVPCRIGKNGVEKIVELELNQDEKEKFLKVAANLKKQCDNLPLNRM